MTAVERLPSTTADADDGVVVLDVADLAGNRALTDAAIEAAFGPSGMGIIALRNVQGFTERRQALLPLAYRFSHLPDNVKAKYEDEKSSYNFGWSHGKEKLEGEPDLRKGSYYANPSYDRPTEDAALIDKYPTFLSPNIWPRDDLPELETAFKSLGQLFVEVGEKLARACDAYIAGKLPSYRANLLERTVRESLVCKGRLLHYFPVSAEELASQGSNSGSWCGYHNDHGSLTGLAPAMFLDANGNEITNPDPTSGLYIRRRNGKIVKVVVPADLMAFQIGECSQIHSGGLLQATPHCVRGPTTAAGAGISRETFAIFMEPNWNEPMSVPEGRDPLDVTDRASSQRELPPGVVPLKGRWENGIDFAEFTRRTIDSFY